MIQGSGYYHGEKSDGSTIYDGQYRNLRHNTHTMMYTHDAGPTRHCAWSPSLLMCPCAKPATGSEKSVCWKSSRSANKACKIWAARTPSRRGGLNPHWARTAVRPRGDRGDHSAIGLQGRGHHRRCGSLPAGLRFLSGLGGWYDIVVCMYHDQGHIPIKTVGFSNDQ